MDVRMPNVDGVEATRRLAAAGSPARVLILTTFDLDEYVYEAIRAGASGFLLKDVQPAQLVEAVRVVAAGEALLAPTVTRRLLDRFADQLPSSQAAAGARAADRARAGDPHAAGRGAVERRAGRAAVPQRDHRQDPRLQRAAQARAARPRPGRRPRVQGRPRATSSLRTSRTVLAAEGRGRTFGAMHPTPSRPPVSRSASATGSPSTTSSCASRAARRSATSGPTAPARRR